MPPRVIVHDFKREDIAFTLIGKGDCFDELVALRDELKLNGHVEFTGRAPDELVGKVHVHRGHRAVPGPDESAQRPVHHEQDDGVHVLRASGGGVRPPGDPGLGRRRRRLREADGDPEQDVRDYAQAIVDLIDDVEERARMGKLGRARVEEELAWPHQQRAYLGVYAGVAAAGSHEVRGLTRMCGIAGCYQQADGHKLTDVMTERIAHRGPDAGAIWSHEDERASIHLGHRRLSIIDLSASANQPLVKGGLTLVYNGELYNYRELRAELEKKGASFITSSDTEVVLEAWRHWGPEALPRFRGMFAFAIADTATGELVLARDPLGIKPLLYLRRGSGIVFASELKALLSAVGPELKIDHGAMVASMLYYWVPEQRCSIQGVSKLPAGSWACFRPDGTHEEQSYWRVQDVAREAAQGPAADLEGCHRGERHRAPGRRRPGVELPVRRAGLQHRHGARPPAGGQRRRVHDHLPAGGPEARGDAGRRDLRAQGRPAVRH